MSRNRSPRRLRRLDVVRDAPRFVLSVPRADDANLCARFVLGPQGLAEPPLVVGDQPRRGAQNMPGGTVIPFQADRPRAGEVLLEAQDVAHLGAAPGVDRLVVVADAAQIATFHREQAQPQILRDIGVLILVDQKVAEAAAVFRQHVRMAGEHRDVVQSRSPKSAAFRTRKRS